VPPQRALLSVRQTLSYQLSGLDLAAGFREIAAASTILKPTPVEHLLKQEART
jgi:hypothetical protein